MIEFDYTERLGVFLPKGWFDISVQPEGPAPEHMRQAWVGLAYPVARLSDDGSIVNIKTA